MSRTTLLASRVTLPLVTLLLACGLAACGTSVPSNNDTSAAPDAVSDAPSTAETGADVVVPTDDVPPSRPDVYDPYNDPDARSPSTAITAPNEQWTWVPFSDAVCANGSPTGIAVNLTDRSRNVMIFMMGGGACWDSITCYTLGTAANVDSGYNEASWQGDRAGIGGLGIFSRTESRNPFRDMSFVFVPYCTGDVHSGNRITAFNAAGGRRNTFFVGHRNMEVFLRRLAPTFAGAERVWLTGASAGGFGAAVNWDQVQTAFGSSRVDVIDDSGPPINSGRYATLVTQWNPYIPPDCAECRTRMDAMIEYLGARYGTTRRFGLLSYTQDSTISQFAGVTAMEFERQLLGLRERFDAISGMGYFFLPGTNHVLLTNFTSLRTPGGVALVDWLNAMVSDSNDWRSAGPQ